MRSEDGLAGESHEHRRTTVERPLLRTPSNRVLASPPIGHRVVPLCTAVRLYSQLPSGSYLPSAEGASACRKVLTLVSQFVHFCCIGKHVGGGGSAREKAPPPPPTHRSLQRETH